MAATTRNSKESAANTTRANDDNKNSKGNPDESSASNAAQDSNTAQPLGPPPRPRPNGETGPDYFNQSHNGNTGPYQSEPNPFEAQFSNPADTPGKIGLPSVAALTSPSSLLPGDTPGWNSLRSGPLSPAMLAGPTGGTDYFDSNFSRGFPTPNESSLRTGLTPGGGGSMFPAPSPNSQSLFNSLQLGANTPNTLEFLRTAGGVAKAASNGVNGPTSQPTENQSSNNMDLKLPASSQPPTSDAYAQHDADAANGLFMLAQSNGARSGNQFAVPQQPNSQSNSTAEPSSVNSRGQKNSITSGTTQVDDSSDSDESEQAKPATRSRGKKAAEPKNNRRKATDTPSKAPASKRQKANAVQEAKAELSDDGEELGKDGKKMTDEEKRKNFLERNRVAALKCRQRKKQWLQNLQTKVDLYTQENDALTQTVNQLREQVMSLKQLLLSHKDCPVTASQGVSPQAFATFLSQIDAVVPYGGPVNPVNGVTQGMPMMMPDARQGPPLQRS